MTSSTARQALIDTSVYIENLKFGQFERELLTLPFLVCCNAVVLAELWHGACLWQAKRFGAALARQCRVIVPNEGAWLESGQIVARLAEGVKR